MLCFDVEVEVRGGGRCELGSWSWSWGKSPTQRDATQCNPFTAGGSRRGQLELDRLRPLRLQLDPFPPPFRPPFPPLSALRIVDLFSFTMLAGQWAASGQGSWPERCGRGRLFTEWSDREEEMERIAGRGDEAMLGVEPLGVLVLGLYEDGFEARDLGGPAIPAVGTHARERVLRDRSLEREPPVEDPKVIRQLPGGAMLESDHGIPRDRPALPLFGDPERPVGPLR